MEAEEKNKNVKKKVFDRLKDINGRHSTLQIIRGGVLKKFEFKIDNEVKKQKHEIKEEMLNVNTVDNSLFGQDVLKKYGIEKDEYGEYVMNNQPKEKEHGEELEIG